MMLKNVIAATLSPPRIERVDLRIKNGKISEKRSSLQPKQNEEVVDLDGKILMPGFVNAHTHLYSTLSRGMPAPKERPRNFLETLQKVWWKLDRALDEEAIYYSALVGAIDAVRHGTTTLIDHHASPKAITSSLDIIKDAVSKVGLRGVLCYEVTDRGGKKERDDGLVENERFIQQNETHSHFRGLVGAHASFTLENESLYMLGELATKHNTGVHIHVAEDVCDVLYSKKRHRVSVVPRLACRDILNRKSILAHCINLTPSEFKEISRLKSWVVHNPRSNMNNNVGHAPIHLFGERAALGTDGFPSDMFEEARIGFFRNQENQKRLQVSGYRFQDVSLPKMLDNGQALITQLFEQNFGTIEKGSVADLIVIEYIPPTPLTNENLVSHFLFGMSSSLVESVMIEGKWIVWNKEILGIDVSSIYQKASRVAKKLWKRME
jgi:putative selenium metabolism protein SsnA